MIKNNRDEQIYKRGEQVVARDILTTALTYLPKTDGDEVRWRIERADIVAQLRDVCDRFGDNDWPDNLHLGDVIQKHLVNYLEEGE